MLIGGEFQYQVYQSGISIYSSNGILTFIF